MAEDTDFDESHSFKSSNAVYGSVQGSIAAGPSEERHS